MLLNRKISVKIQKKQLSGILTIESLVNPFIEREGRSLGMVRISLFEGLCNNKAYFSQDSFLPHMKLRRIMNAISYRSWISF